MPKMSDTPGIRARGNSIQIDFYYKGVRCRETLKIKPTASNLKQAQHLLGKIQFEIAFGNFNYSDYFANSKRAQKFGCTLNSRITVSEALDWWYEQNVSQWRKQTIKGNKFAIKNHLKPGLGQVLLINLTSSQIKEWRSSLGIANKTINNVMICLRQMLLSAIEAGFISSNPAEHISNLKHQRKEPLPLLTHEIDLLGSALNPCVKEFYEFAIWTGLRTGEQCGLKWSDIDFNGATFFVCRSLSDQDLNDTKTPESRRRIELLAPAYATLESLKEMNLHSEWVFVNPITGKPWTFSPLRKFWHRGIRKLNLPARAAYQTRHTFATLMLNAGLPLSWIQAQLGHTNYRMLETRYAKWQYDDTDVVKWVKRKTQGGHNGPRFTELFLKKH